MKKNLFSALYLFAFIATIGITWSCTKQNASLPGEQTSLTAEDALQADEAVAANVTPGTYGILKFIDTGDDETQQFNGYKFEFKANGALVATTNTGAVFNGTWRLNSAQTRMELNIKGTPALNDLDDDDWKVVTITNKRISLKKNGPDKVIFVM